MPMQRVLFAVALIATMLAANLNADVLQVAGSASGCFTSEIGGPCLGSSILNIFTYNPAPGFNAATNSAGYLNLTGNLGSFSLQAQPWYLDAAIYAADLMDFRMLVNFALPSGITGPNPAHFKAELQGHARWGRFPWQEGPPEYIEVEFDNNIQHIEFANQYAIGGFDLIVEDMTFANGYATFEGGSSQLRGSIANAVANPVPEPGSVALLGTVLSGIAFGIYRKRVR